MAELQNQKNPVHKKKKWHGHCTVIASNDNPFGYPKDGKSISLDGGRTGGAALQCSVTDSKGKVTVAGGVGLDVYTSYRLRNKRQPNGSAVEYKKDRGDTGFIAAKTGVRVASEVAKMRVDLYGEATGGVYSPKVAKKAQDTVHKIMGYPLRDYAANRGHAGVGGYASVGGKAHIVDVGRDGGAQANVSATTTLTLGTERALMTNVTLEAGKNVRAFPDRGINALPGTNLTYENKSHTLKLGDHRVGVGATRYDFYKSQQFDNNHPQKSSTIGVNAFAELAIPPVIVGVGAEYAQNPSKHPAPGRKEEFQGKLWASFRF